VLLRIFLYTEIQPEIMCIVDCYTQDMCERNEAQRMPFVFRCLLFLNTHVSFCSVGRITKIFHILQSCMMQWQTVWMCTASLEISCQSWYEKLVPFSAVLKLIYFLHIFNVKFLWALVYVISNPIHQIFNTIFFPIL